MSPRPVYSHSFFLQDAVSLMHVAMSSTNTQNIGSPEVHSSLICLVAVFVTADGEMFQSTSVEINNGRNDK